MKQIFAFSLLFCLVFLNVPRSIVHDCEHDHPIEHHDYLENDSEDYDIASLVSESESCFICEFDLDVFEIPVVSIESFAKCINSTLVDRMFDCFNQTDCISYSLRGPPTA